MAKIQRMTEALVGGNRLALSKAITLVESSNARHYALAQRLLADALYQVNSAGDGGGRKCIRLGIAGPPGAGKSTFIEALGLFLTEQEGAPCRFCPRNLVPSTPRRCHFAGFTKQPFAVLL